MPTLQAAPAVGVAEAWGVDVHDDGDWTSRSPNAESLEALEDVRLRRNLYGPFATVDEAIRSMLEGSDNLDVG